MTAFRLAFGMRKSIIGVSSNSFKLPMITSRLHLFGKPYKTIFHVYSGCGDSEDDEAPICVVPFSMIWHTRLSYLTWLLGTLFRV